MGTLAESHSILALPGDTLSIIGTLFELVGALTECQSILQQSVDTLNPRYTLWTSSYFG